MMRRTALVYDDVCLRHHTGNFHPETAGRLPAILGALDAAGIALPRLSAPPATRDDLLRNHSAEHIDRVAAHCRTGLRYPDPDTVMGPGSWEAALYAAGAGIAACRAVLAGECDNAFCIVRPPGHHAEADQAMGFCLFNNVAVTARWLRAVAGRARVAIVDWDVHHGNGTQHSFYDDDSVYYVSLHEFPNYPGTGLADERGVGDTNLNFPLPPGTKPAVWIDRMRDNVVPALAEWNPDFLLISAGFDAHRSDPLASQLLDAAHFAEMTRLLAGLAGGRVVALLEGGYDLDALGESAVATITALQA
jgi:acetoin utilization deacetylase AcuC-like enzyme